jgi:hypothetical protein
MSTETDISALYREFADALTEVLAENAVGLARRGRLARARAAVKKHPEYSEHAYFLAVETAFKNWGSHAKCRSLGAASQLGRHCRRCPAGLGASQTKPFRHFTTEPPENRNPPHAAPLSCSCFASARGDFLLV